jgi:hypothetical protein
LTVTTTRIGATRKYAAGWEAAFGGKKRAAKKSAKATAATAKKTTQRRKATISKSKSK